MILDLVGPRALDLLPRRYPPMSSRTQGQASYRGGGSGGGFCLGSEKLAQCG